MTRFKVGTFMCPGLSDELRVVGLRVAAAAGVPAPASKGQETVFFASSSLWLAPIGVRDWAGAFGAMGGTAMAQAFLAADGLGPAWQLQILAGQCITAVPVHGGQRHTVYLPADLFVSIVEHRLTLSLTKDEVGLPGVLAALSAWRQFVRAFVAGASTCGASWWRVCLP